MKEKLLVSILLVVCVLPFAFLGCTPKEEPDYSGLVSSVDVLTYSSTSSHVVVLVKFEDGRILIADKDSSTALMLKAGQYNKLYLDGCLIKGVEYDE